MENKNIRGKKLRKIKYDSKLNINEFLMGLFLLLIGIVLGITISLNSTFALEAATASNATSSNATASNATSSNATASNATSSNATASNATSSNATASNATSSNVQKTDNILYLNSLTLKYNAVKPGDKVYIEKSTSGACNTSMSLTFWNEQDDSKFTVNIENINNGPYFEIPNNVISGDYKLINVLLIGLNSDNTTFSREYDNTNTGDVTDLIFNSVLKIEGSNKKNIEFSDLTVNNNGIIGQSVAVNFSTSEKLTSLKLLFKDQGGNSFSTYVQSLTVNPYFIIPSQVIESSYYLYQAVFVTDEVSTVYTNGENYNFKCTLNVKKNADKTFVYSNKDITEDIIKEIYNEEEDIDVTINADENSIISSELFNAIKGTKKNLVINYKDNKIIFCGTDIETAKAIDVSMSTIVVSDDKELSELLNDGIIVNFASNGNLPGNALIKIKVTDKMQEIFKDNKIYVYYYDEEKEGFNIIAEEVLVKDGYYEFIISHNSKYVLTKFKVSDNLVLETEENIVHFQQSDSHYLLWIGMSVLLIVVVMGVIFVVKTRKRKN